MMRRYMAIALGLSVFLASACAGSTTSHEEPAMPALVTDLNIDVQEFHFSPTLVAVPAGALVSVTVGNKGTIAHEWVIIAHGHEVDDEHRFSESAVLFEVDDIDQGTRSTSKFTIAQPGRYQLICAIEGHFAAGMEATLMVV
jgi:plastocyanin